MSFGTRPVWLLLLWAVGSSAVFGAEPATVTVRTISLDAAVRAARAALTNCSKSGYQVAVAVVDRFGVPVVLLRDRYAGPHTPETAIGKAWTAVSFKISTRELARSTEAGQPMSAIRNLPRVVAAGGGLPIEAGGSLVGGIGVSGAPGGDADEACATAGIQAIAEDLEFQ